MIASPKLLIISTILATAMAATPVVTDAAEIDPNVKCTQDRNCGTDVNCIARCFNVPSPDDQDISKTLGCIAECKSDDIVAMTNCRQSCIGEYFQATGAVTSKPTESSTSNASPTSSEIIGSGVPVSSETISSEVSISSETSSSGAPTPSSSEDVSTDSDSAASPSTVFSVISLTAAFAALSVLL